MNGRLCPPVAAMTAFALYSADPIVAAGVIAGVTGAFKSI